MRTVTNALIAIALTAATSAAQSPLSESDAKQRGVRPGDAVTGTLSTPEEQDSYTLTVTREDTLVLQVTNPFLGIDNPYQYPELRIRIRDTQRREVLQEVGVASGAQHALYGSWDPFVLPVGTYQLQLEMADRTTRSFAYGFLLTTHRSAAEAGDGPLTVGAPLEGRINTMDDVDLYAFTATEGQEVRISGQVLDQDDHSVLFQIVDSPDAPFPLHMTVLGFAPQPEDTDWRRIPQTGTYYLRVHANSDMMGGYLGRYRATVQLRD